jgi:hypothetical protein
LKCDGSFPEVNHQGTTGGLVIHALREEAEVVSNKEENFQHLLHHNHYHLNNNNNIDKLEDLDVSPQEV